MNKIIILLFAFVAICACHSTKYTVDRNVTCYEPTPAPIQSWHIHILYWQNSQKSVEGAMKIRDHFIKDFSDILGTPCTDLFHQDHLCMFEPDNEPAGPFLTAQWSAFVPLEHFQRVTSWSIQNRNGYDLLVHPNSGCEVEDHTWWAMWSGTAWQLDSSIFSHDQPFPWPSDDEEEQNNTAAKFQQKQQVSTLKDHQKKAQEESLLIRLFNKQHHH